MAKSKLVCNLRMDDFFMLPDSPEVWRKKGKEAVWVVDDHGKWRGYECVSVYDPDLVTTLPAGIRVMLQDN